MTKREEAVLIFEKGYNCAQSVAGAFCDRVDVDFNTMMKLTSGFGGGMGRLREVCGAVTGMFVITGLLYGYDSPEDIKAKKELYGRIQTLAMRFKELNSSYICRELLGLSIQGADSTQPEKRTAEYYKKRPCKDLVGDAAEILEDYLLEN